MTMRCPKCDGEVQVYDTNDAEYPEPLVEQVRCQQCGYEYTHTLTA